jgi:hypothetical protein
MVSKGFLLCVCICVQVHVYVCMCMDAHVCMRVWKCACVGTMCRWFLKMMFPLIVFGFHSMQTWWLVRKHSLNLESWSFPWPPACGMTPSPNWQWQWVIAPSKPANHEDQKSIQCTVWLEVLDIVLLLSIMPRKCPLQCFLLQLF